MVLKTPREMQQTKSLRSWPHPEAHRAGRDLGQCKSCKLHVGKQRPLWGSQVGQKIEPAVEGAAV